MSVASYDAFVSYRSTAKVSARRIKAALEGLAQPKNGDEPFRLFLDEASLLVGDLSEKIEAGLRSSRALIVLMAQDTVESKWVNREIEVWLENGGVSAHLFLIRVDDVDLSWNEEANDWASPEVIPSALHGVFTGEQKYIDLSGASRRGVERTAVAPVFAAVRGRTIESLLLEEAARAQRRQRTVMSVAAAVAVLLVVAIAAGIWALISRNRAEAATHDAVTNLIASQARVTSATDLEQALVLADTAYKSAGRPEHSETLYNVAAATPELVNFFSLGSQATAVDATPDGDIVVAGTSAGEIVQFARSTRTRTDLGKIDGEVTFVGVSHDGRTVVASACKKDSTATCATNSWTRWRDGTQEEPSPGIAMALSPSGQSVAIIPEIASGSSSPIEVRRGERIQRYEVALLSPSWIVLPDDKSITALNEHGLFLRASRGRPVQHGRIGMGTYMFGGSLAQDGKHFTYTNGGETIAVWDLSAAKGSEDELEAQRAGATRSASVSGIALSPDGSRLVTASDGSLSVSGVAKDVSDARGVETLAGAGPSPHSLRFVGQNTLVSAAGTSVALWDLSRTNAFVKSWNVEFSPARNTLVHVSVNDGRTKAVVQGSQNFFYANLSSGRVWASAFDSWLAESVASIWLDDRRLLVINHTKGQAAILSSGLAEAQQLPFEVPIECRSSTWGSSIARRDDGRVVMLGVGARLLIEPETHTVTCDGTDASALTSDGQFLVQTIHAGTGDEGGLIKVFAADTMEQLGSVTIDAAPLEVADVTSHGQLAVLAYDSVNDVVETVLIDTSRWSVSATQLLRAAPPEAQATMYGARVDRGRVVVQEGTTVALYDLASGVRTPLIDVGTSVTTEPGFGFSPDGRTLAVSAHAEGKLYVLPLDPAEWSTIACGRAWGASPGAALARQLKDTKGLIQGCQP